jgi:excisionase family DNA binding protein
VSAPLYLTVREAARLLRVSPMTVYRMCREDELESRHVGPRTIRIVAADFYRKYPELEGES